MNHPHPFGSYTIGLSNLSGPIPTSISNPIVGMVGEMVCAMIFRSPDSVFLAAYPYGSYHNPYPASGSSSPRVRRQVMQLVRKKKEGMDILLKSLVPYIEDGDDRNSFSLVCRKSYELDSLAREELTVHLFYATKLSSRLSKRFPSLKSLTLKGLKLHEPLLDVTLWIKEIVTSTFDHLEKLDLRFVQVGDQNLELLAKTRAKQLKELWIYASDKFSTDGLKHICHHCINMTRLRLQSNQIIIKDAEWLHELALHNSCMEDLTFYYPVIDFDVNDLTLLAKNCSQSLECVTITSRFSTVDLKDFFNSAVMLEDFYGGDQRAKNKEDYAGFKYPPNMKSMRFDGRALTDELGLVVPFAHKLIRLELYEMKKDDQCGLLERCRNLEYLYVSSVYAKKGLQLIARICKNLQTIKIYDKYLPRMGLITLAQGCPQLEQIRIKLVDISEEALGCVGAHLKNLRDFRMTSLDMTKRTSIPPKQIQALLIGCTKLEKLSINLVHRRLTGEGMEYITVYGHELRYLSLNFTGIPELHKLSSPKLRVLKIKDCQFTKEDVLSFVFNNITSLRYIYVWNEKDEQYLPTTRPGFA